VISKSKVATLGVQRYGGNWSACRERKALELVAAQHDLADAEKRASEAAENAQVQAERKARKDAVGRRRAARGEMPRISAASHHLRRGF
jgi:ATPase subunit of ABC transporter with duplicated ATPase domains